MKKLVCLLMMTLAIAYGLLPGCAEVSETIKMSQENTYESATSMCFLGDALYILGNRGIYIYDGDELTTCVDLSDTNMYRYNPIRPEDEEQAAAWDRVISHIFTDGTSLYPYLFF